MRTSKSLPRVVFLLTISLLIFFGPALFSDDPPHRKPGGAVDRLMFRAFDVDRAPRDLEAGNMDLYMFSLKTAAAERLRGDDRFRLIEAPASTVSLLLNPAPAPGGEFNPFSIPEIRRAVQYLVDREFISRDIYRGMAVPMISHVSPQEFDYLTVYDIEKESGIGYDPDYGRQLIDEEMKKAGATLVDGVWNFGGQPILIRLIGRVEDERRNIADLIRTELEHAGFAVAISYRPFAAAVISVYSTDPQTFQWHIYTEGWGRSSPQRYDYATINQMTSPWLGNMPGWQEIGFWQYANPYLDELGKRLFRGEFASVTERDQIYREMTSIGLDESVRIWLATVVNSFPARKELTNISPDLVGGIRSPWTLREAFIPGKSELTVGHLWVWTERTTWNPIGGLGDVYSVDIWRYLNDPAMWNHPFTGLPQPMRIDYRVQTSGPTGKVTVPSDAVMWNTENKKWTPVGNGVRTTSKVTFDYSRYFQSKWHHGESISMADVVYSIAQGYELAYDRDKSRIEVAIGVTSRPFLETFRGYRILDDLRLEVYVDYWHFEENHIASYANPAGLSVPWELLAAMDDLVFNQRRAAYSDTAASRFNVPWINLVMDQDARLVERTLRSFSNGKTFPENYFQIGGKTLVDTETAVNRYKAAIAWYKEYGHMIISNGPYYLYRYDPPAQYAELRAYRDPSYPYKPGDWNFGEPPNIEITKVDAPEIIPGKASEIRVSVNGPGTLGLKYLLLDPATRTVVTQGEARPSNNKGDFVVMLSSSLTNNLFPGLYQMSFVAYSDELALVVDRTVDVDVAS